MDKKMKQTLQCVVFSFTFGPLPFYILDSTPVLPVKLNQVPLRLNRIRLLRADLLEMPCFANKNITAINFIN